MYTSYRESNEATHVAGTDYYGDTFFQNAGSSLSPYVIQCILGGVSVAGTIPALYLIDTWGRRRVNPVSCNGQRVLTTTYFVVSAYWCCDGGRLCPDREYCNLLWLHR